MRSLQTRLYSFAAPLALLPLLDFSFSQVPKWFVGVEFRTLLSDVVSTSFAQVADALIFFFMEQLFGVML